MNRHERRVNASIMTKATPDHDADAIMQVMVLRMAEKGPGVVVDLRTAVGGDYNPGQALDVLLKATAAMEAAIMARDGAAFVDLAAMVLFLARDVAISQGVIKIGKVEEPS